MNNFTIDTGKRNASKTECNICCDTGIIRFQKVFNGLKYDTAARCTCPKGLSLNHLIARIDNVFDLEQLKKDIAV